MKRRTIQGYTLDEDTRLMLKAAGGDKTAYARLYKKYFAAVVSFVLSLGKSYESPQDIAQDVFAYERANSKLREKKLLASATPRSWPRVYRKAVQLTILPIPLRS